MRSIPRDREFTRDFMVKLLFHVTTQSIDLTFNERSTFTEIDSI